MEQRSLVGPLALMAEGYKEELHRLGYGPRSEGRQMRLLAHLSGWISDNEIPPEEVTSGVVTAFLAERRRLGLRLMTRSGARPLLDYLRRQGVIPEALEERSGPLASLLERYHNYLTRQRGLRLETVANYEAVAKAFIAGSSIT